MTLADEGRLRPTYLELHSGVVSGASPATPPPVPTTSDPRAALEDLVAGALRRGPCVVQFSGGRDSSLVLAVAAHVARMHGHDLPTALSVRYPELPGSDESQWQDLVIDHLKVPHEVIEVRNGDNELCAPLGVSGLLRLGPLMPAPASVSVGRIGARVDGRTVLSGQGGDEILGHSRITSYVAHWRRRRRPSRAMAGVMARDALPRPMRKAMTRVEMRDRRESTWLKPSVERQVVRQMVDSATDRPWDWRGARWQALHSRMWVVGSTNLRAVANAEGFELRHPLMEPAFVAAVCARGGPRGLTTRTEAMRVLAGDLLPEALLTRSTKAAFNNAYAGDRVRAFARDWDGSGVDHGLVDVERLRAAWSAPRIVAAALAPLQLALLAAHGQPFEPDLSELVP